MTADPTVPVPPPRRAARMLLQWAARAVALTVLGMVFGAYMDPDLAFVLASRTWACF